MVNGARLGCFVVLLTLLVFGGEAGAQTAGATHAAIDGTIADASGAPLPGATITVSGRALQGQRVVVTGSDGLYRVPQLPPGEYRIAYELSGFATVLREKQQLAAGFNATIDLTMEVSTMQETVTVEGASPVVDQKASTVTTNFDEEKLATLPSSRDIWSILAVSPAVQVQRVDVGGSTAGTQTGYSAYDTKSDQHRPMVEGMVLTEGTNAAGFYYDYGSFSEVSVSSGSHAADMGWPGIRSSFISKSGGNQYRGRAYLDYQSGDIQSYNIDDAQAQFLRAGGGLEARDLNRMVDYRDVNLDAGGYVKKDVLWWYGSFRDQEINVRYPNFPVQPFATQLRNYTAKGTYTLSPNNKLIGYTQWGRKAQPNRLDYYTTSSSTAQHSSEISTWNQSLLGNVWKGEWNSVLSDRMFLEVRGGRFGYDWANDRYGNEPSYQDLGNNLVSGSNRNWGQNISREQVSGALSLYQGDLWGTHNFKLGGEVFREGIEYLRGLPGNGGDGTSFPGNLLHVLRNGAPIEIYQFAGPTESLNGLWTYAGFLSDTWQLNRRTTLNLGVRYDRYRGYIPEQGMPASNFFPDARTVAAIDNVFTWNLFSPRLGFNYDLTGDGKTLIKANYGQYWWNPGTTLASNVNTNPPDVFRRYGWTDRNGDLLWQEGEQGALLGSQGGVGSAGIDPKLKDTWTREASLWLDRELLPNFGVRAGMIYRRIGNYYQVYNANRPFDTYSVPVSVTDPGVDGLLGTGDDGASYQAFNLSAAALALPVLNQVQNGPGRSEFWTFEATGTKRLSDGWSLLSTFSYRWNYDFEDAYFGNNLRARDLPQSVNDLINTDEGRYNFNTWAFKLTGTYDAPWDIRLAPSYRHQSGQPFGRTFLATMNYGAQRVLAEPIDSQRQANIHVIDLRVEKSLPFGARRVGLVLDVYNITNANTEQNINWGSGSTYLAPSTIIGPRILRFGARFDW